MKLYCIDVFIARKALQEGRDIREVKKELRELLGLGVASFDLIRNAEVGDSTTVTRHLLKMAEYFGCTMDDLLNKPAKVTQ